MPPATVSFFMLNCMTCHGPDEQRWQPRAAMPPLPDFTAKEWQHAHSNAQLKVSIFEGKGTLMPPWGGKVSPELARASWAPIRGFGPPGLLASEAGPASDF